MNTQDVHWRIEMLGGLRVAISGKVIDRFQTQKTGALLAYLACHSDRRHPREQLVDLLWPDAEIGPGRNRLSQALGSLRSQFEDAESSGATLFVADRMSVGINRALISTDTAEFEAAVLSSSAGEYYHIETLLRAVSLYRGDLLPGFYDDWVLTERERLLGLFVAALRRLMVHYEQVREWETAVTYARRALATDPAAEEFHQDVIRLLVASGQSAAARRQFRELERLLHDEHGEQPANVTRALLNRLDREEPSYVPSAQTQAAALPAPLTRFFGREGEIAEALPLVQAAEVRLVTLTGSGGAGKTRLALEIAARLKMHYEGVVLFIPLADLSDARLVPTALLDTMRLPHKGVANPLELAAEAFSRLPSLLILDNVEHLLEGVVPLIRQLLTRAPALSILVTSRQRLGVDGEQEVVVPPLPIPEESLLADLNADETERVMRVDSVRLFVDRARAVRPGFAITGGNSTAVIRLCRRLEGLPLAIELCAAWAQTLTPSQMLLQLTRRFDLLVSRRADIPPRHRSLRAAVEYSYLLLPSDLQQFFVGLSVFRGGWSLEAAEAVNQDQVQAPLGALTALTELRERSLVTAEEADGVQAGLSSEPRMRYRMLEALREFAFEQQTLAVKTPLRSRHAAYFLELAETAAQYMAGPEQGAWLGRLEVEHDNLRAVLAWAVDSGDTQTGLRLSAALSVFWDLRGFLSEGEEWLDRLLAVPQMEQGSREQLLVRAKALDARGLLARGRAEFGSAEAAVQQALSLWKELEDNRGIALSLQFLATISYSREDYDTARSFLAGSLHLARSLNDLSLVARILNSQGNIAMEQREWAEAQANFSESLSMHRASGDRKRYADSLNNLALAARYQGDLDTALDLLQECLAICRALSDRSGISITLLNLATVYRLKTRFSEARLVLGEAFSLLSEADGRRALAWCIKEAGHLACADRDYYNGVRLLSASETLRHVLGMSFSPADPEELDRDTASSRSALGDAAFESAWSAGNRMSLSEARAAALPENNRGSEKNSGISG